MRTISLFLCIFLAAAAGVFGQSQQEYDLLIRNGRRGKFMACTGYPKCKYTESVKEA